MGLGDWREEAGDVTGRRIWTRRRGGDVASVAEEPGGTFHLWGLREGPLRVWGNLFGIKTLEAAVDLGEKFLGLKEILCPATTGSANSPDASPSTASTSS